MEENTNATAQEQTQVPKKKGLAIILCLLGGMLGIHKFYEGKIFMGLLYLVTFGFCGIGVLIDLIKLIGKPSVYYVEKKQYLNAVKNFSYDTVGKVLSGVGGVVIGLSASFEWNLTMILAGVILFAAGVALTWLKTRDIKNSLISNGIVIAVAAVGTLVFALLIAAVIVYIAVKLILGIDLIEFFTDIFGDDKKKKRIPTEKEDMDAALSSLSIPDHITGPYGHGYHRVSSSAFSSDFASDVDGTIITIHDSDIEVSAAGMYADTNDGHFYW